jgi:methylated-DNA-[protein]-cysteine S-methyltransferase
MLLTIRVTATILFTALRVDGSWGIIIFRTRKPVNYSMRYSLMESPVGRLTIAEEDDRLRFILFCSGNRAAGPLPEWLESGSSVIDETIRQLRAYFDGNLTAFDLPLKPAGTPFQLEVWRELRRIPFGTVISYGELANRVHRPKASRAVGAANGSNPIPIVIPCHRVIGSDGKMTGYGGGVWIKEVLLKLEGVESRGSRERLLFE